MKKKTSLPKKVLHEYYFYLFEQRMDNEGYVKCFECEKPLHQTNYQENLFCYSHLLEKSKYVELAGKPDNIKIVCPDCHILYTLKPKKAIKQYNEFLKLKEKYNV